VIVIEELKLNMAMSSLFAMPGGASHQNFNLKLNRTPKSIFFNQTCNLVLN
jgi:hypothetical protein